MFILSLPKKDSDVHGCQLMSGSTVRVLVRYLWYLYGTSIPNCSNHNEQKNITPGFEAWRFFVFFYDVKKFFTFEFSARNNCSQKERKMI
jgi:hypothetical protein